MKCCERDHNNDGNCDVHRAPGVKRGERDADFVEWWISIGREVDVEFDPITLAEAAWNAAVEAENKKRLENGGPG